MSKLKKFYCGTGVDPDAWDWVGSRDTPTEGVPSGRELAGVDEDFDMWIEDQIHHYGNPKAYARFIFASAQSRPLLEWERLFMESWIETPDRKVWRKKPAPDAERMRKSIAKMHMRIEYRYFTEDQKMTPQAARSKVAERYNCSIESVKRLVNKK